MWKRFLNKLSVAFRISLGDGKYSIHAWICLQDPVQRGTLRYMSPEILEGSVDLRNNRYLLPADVYSLALLLWEVWMCCSDFSNGTLSWYLLSRIQVVCSRQDISLAFSCFWLQAGLLHGISCHMNLSWEPAYPQRASFCMCVTWTWGLPYRNTGKSCHRYSQIYYGC